MLKKGIILIIGFLLISSCKTYHLAGKKYQASNQEKFVKIEFLNDTLCNVEQKFLCDELSEEYKSIVFDATYRVDRVNIKTQDESLKNTRFKADVLILNNLDCPNCEKYSVIPNYEDLGCTTEEITDSRFKSKIKFGVIYNMANDTLVINKDNHIVLNRLKLKPQ